MNQKKNSKITLKDRILSKAKSRFVRFGFKKTTIEEICRDARVSRKSIYTHFKNKEDILVSLFIRETLRMRENSLQAAEHLDDPVEKIKQMAFASFEYMEREPFLTTMLAKDEEIYAPYLQKKFNNYVQAGMINIIDELLQKGIEQKRIRDIDTRLISYLLFKLFQSLAYARSIPSPPDVEGLKQEYDKFFDLVINGFIFRENK